MLNFINWRNKNKHKERDLKMNTINLNNLYLILDMLDKIKNMWAITIQKDQF